ncbi:MAG: hypothetical protein GC137_08775 [Alphaproteobacteria bacterium]|nr:hypothetical protein [Alphaproteobacteria bacterium]
MADKYTPEDKGKPIATLDLEEDIEAMPEKELEEAFQADTSKMGPDGEDLDLELKNQGLAEGYGFSIKDQEKQMNDALSGASGKSSTTFSVAADRQEKLEEEKKRDVRRAAIAALMSFDAFSESLDDLLNALEKFGDNFEKQDNKYNALYSSYENKVTQLQEIIDLKQQELDKLIAADPEGNAVEIAALKQEIELRQQFLADYQEESSDLTSDRNSLSIEFAQLQQEHSELVEIRDSCRRGRKFTADDQKRLEDLEAKMKEIDSKLEDFKCGCDARNKVDAIETPFMALLMNRDRVCTPQELSALEEFRQMRKEFLADDKLTQAEQEALTQHAQSFSKDIGKEQFHEIATEIAEKNIQVEQENGEFVSGKSAFDYLSNKFSDLLDLATARLGAFGAALKSGVNVVSNIIDKARASQSEAETDAAAGEPSKTDEANEGLNNQTPEVAVDEPTSTPMTFELFGQQVLVQQIPSASVPSNYASYSDNPYRSVLDDYPQYNDPEATYMTPIESLPSASAVAGFQNALSSASTSGTGAPMPDSMELAAAEQRRLQEELERQRRLDAQNELDGPKSPNAPMV